MPTDQEIEDAWAHKSIFENGERCRERIPRDANGFSIGIAGSDEHALLTECAMFTDTGVWQGLFTYPGCGWVLVSRGWVTQDTRITDAGYAALRAGRAVQ